MDDLQAQVSQQWDLSAELISNVVEALDSSSPLKLRAFCASMLERGLDVGVIFASYHRIDASCLPRLLAIGQFDGDRKNVAAELRKQLQQLLEAVIEEGLNESPAGIQACYYYAAAEVFAEYLEREEGLDIREFLTCMLEVPVVFLKWCVDSADLAREMMVLDRQSIGEVVAALESGSTDDLLKLRMRLPHYHSMLLYRFEEFVGDQGG